MNSLNSLCLLDCLQFQLWCCFSFHFFRKNETKNRRGSRIAALSRAFTTTSTRCV